MCNKRRLCTILVSYSLMANCYTITIAKKLLLEWALKGGKRVLHYDLELRKFLLMFWLKHFRARVKKGWHNIMCSLNHYQVFFFCGGYFQPMQALNIPYPQLCQVFSPQISYNYPCSHLLHMFMTQTVPTHLWACFGNLNFRNEVC